MARNKSTTSPQHSEYEDRDFESQAMEATGPDTPRKMSKTDAIRAAVAGGHESPGDGVDFIKKQFGLEMSKQHFSATKSKLKATGGNRYKKAGKSPVTAKKRAVPVEDYLAPPQQPAGRDGNLLDALEAIKPLIAQHGAESVKRMVDLLG